MSIEAEKIAPEYRQRQDRALLQSASQIFSGLMASGKVDKSNDHEAMDYSLIVARAFFSALRSEAKVSSVAAAAHAPFLTATNEP
jgi:hypothetical protein